MAPDAMHNISAIKLLDNIPLMPDFNFVMQRIKIYPNVKNNPMFEIKLHRKKYKECVCFLIYNPRKINIRKSKSQPYCFNVRVLYIINGLKQNKDKKRNLTQSFSEILNDNL
jgi:hypothetical protein